MVPFVEVSHLASSTSFYSSVLQPLGLRYIPPPPAERGTLAKLSATAAFGLSEDDIFLQLQQSENPLKPPKLSSIIISAPSASAVAGFHSAWRRSDPPSWSTFRDKRGLERHFGDLDTARAGPWQSNDPRSGCLVTRALLYDLDGNRCEVIRQQPHHSHRHHPSSHKGHDTPRILDWTYDVESSPALTSGRISLRKNSNSNSQRPSHVPPPQHEPPFSSITSRSSFAPSASAPARTVSANMPADNLVSPRQSSRQGGLNTTTVVGAILGAAAGAALTYGFVSNVAAPSQPEPERQRGPPRRATFPDKPVTSQRRQSYHENGINPVEDYNDRKTPRKLVYPDFQGLSIRGGTYGDGDEDVDYGKNPWVDAPRYLTQGPPPQSVVGKSRPPSTFRPVEDAYETRSRHSSRMQGSRPASVRSRSETPRDRVPERVPERVPLPASVVDDYSRSVHRPTHRSVVAESEAPPRSRGTRSRRSSVYHGPEHETFVTAPTHRSSETRHYDYDYPGREAMSRSRAGSQVSTSTVRERARGPPGYGPESRMSARRVALPKSGVGSSHANWDPREVPLPMSGVGSSHAHWDDDMASLAPSDSISCVGSKHSRRSRRYHH